FLRGLATHGEAVAVEVGEQPGLLLRVDRRDWTQVLLEQGHGLRGPRQYLDRAIRLSGVGAAEVGPQCLQLTGRKRRRARLAGVSGSQVPNQRRRVDAPGDDPRPVR